MQRIQKSPNDTDPYTKPTSSNLQPDDHIVIGDLHGNALKLIYALVKHGFIQDMSTADYNELVSIYDTNIINLTEEKILRFRYLLQRQKFSNVGFLHLLGDDTCDRGNCDALTFEVFDAMKNNKIHYKINPSNHGNEFLMGYFNGDYKPPVLEDRHSESLNNLRYLMDEGIIDKNEFSEKVKHIYLPALELISYIVTPDKNKIYLLSHAPIDINVIKHLGTKFGVTVNDNTLDSLVQSIDNINAEFSWRIEHEQFTNLIDQQAVKQFYFDKRPPVKEYPLEYVLWNRSDKGLDLTTTIYGVAGDEYEVLHIHGHCSYNFGEKYICLNNWFGAPDYYRNTDPYCYFQTTGVALNKLEQEPAPVAAAQDEYLQTFEQLIRNIEVKSRCFKRSQAAAKDAAVQLHHALVTAKDTHYATNKEQFKIDCQQAIDTSRVVLNKHRSWKGILANLALFIGSLSVPVLLIPAIFVGIYHYAKYNKFTLYQTASAREINALEKHVRAVPFLAAGG